MTPRSLLALLFFCSGFAGLVLQTVWVRMMVLVFGSTAFAVSTVLAAFMGGLAGGSWLSGRLAPAQGSVRRIVQLYGVLELGIGLYALALPTIARLLPGLHEALWSSASSSYYAFGLARFVLVALLLAPPTLAMGATLPLLAQAYCAPDTTAAATGRGVGTLYALNTGGAVFGVLVAGFGLLPAIGLSLTNTIACVTDLALGGGALLLAGRFTAVASVPTEAGARPPTGAAEGQRPLLAWVALVSIAISGAIAMAYEVAWTRALTLVIGSSTYAFSLILVCFLAGLSLGAALYARRQTGAPDQAGNLGIAHLLAATTSLAGIALIDELPALQLVALGRFSLSVPAVFAIKFAIVALVIFLPTLFMGMVFPAVVRIYADLGHPPARTTAHVYAINTVGAIVGSFAGGFVLIPVFGLQRSLMGLVLVGLGLAGVFGWLSRRRTSRMALPALAVAVAAAGLLWVGPWNLQALSSGVFRLSRYQRLVDSLGARPAPEHDPTPAEARWLRAARERIGIDGLIDTFSEPTVGSRLVWHREGITATVGISRSVDEALSARACWVRQALLVNGKPDASLSVLHARPAAGCAALLDDYAGRAPGIAVSPSGDAETQLLSGVLPIALHDGARPPRRALVIGWGSGVTVGAALRFPLQSVTAVELERAVIDAARLFEPHNLTPARDPRLRLINGDGRNYLATTRERFDVIVSEPSNPWMAGCGNLFTAEFFGRVRRALAPDGVFLQWLQAYEIAPANVWSILATLAASFDGVYVFHSVGAAGDLLVVARQDRRRFDWRRVARRLRSPGLRPLMRSLSIEGPADLAARLLTGPRGVSRLAVGAALNTDDNARIEFATPKDLIDYRRYSSDAIVERLRRADRQPGAFDHVPPDGARLLCMAQLRAGRLADAARGDARCRALATALGDDLPHRPPSAAALTQLLGGAGAGASQPVRPARPQLLSALRVALADPPGRAMGRVAALLDPAVDRRAGFFLLGQLALAAGDDFRGLAWLEAARRLPQAPAEGIYRARVDRMLGRALYARGLHAAGLHRATAGLRTTYPQKNGQDRGRD